MKYAIILLFLLGGIFTLFAQKNEISSVAGIYEYHHQNKNRGGRYGHANFILRPDSTFYYQYFGDEFDYTNEYYGFGTWTHNDSITLNLDKRILPQLKMKKVNNDFVVIQPKVEGRREAGTVYVEFADGSTTPVKYMLDQKEIVFPKTAEPLNLYISNTIRSFVKIPLDNQQNYIEVIDVIKQIDYSLQTTVLYPKRKRLISFYRSTVYPFSEWKKVFKKK